MHIFERIWNGRLTGVPGALWLGVGIMVRRLADQMCTLLWRGNLASFGDGARVQAGVVIRNPGRVHFGARSSIASGVVISAELAEGKCHIGTDVIVASGVRLDFSGNLSIGDNSVISANTVLYTHAHGLNPKSVPCATPLIIESGVWLGSRVVVIEGCGRIGAGSVVASGSVVTREVPSGVLVAGVPARIIKSLSDSL